MAAQRALRRASLRASCHRGGKTGSGVGPALMLVLWDLVMCPRVMSRRGLGEMRSSEMIVLWLYDICLDSTDDRTILYVALCGRLPALGMCHASVKPRGEDRLRGGEGHTASYSTYS